MNREVLLSEPVVDWENEASVAAWLKGQKTLATNGVVCIDERPTAHPPVFIPEEALWGPREAWYPDRHNSPEIVKHEGYMRMPGADFGYAAMLVQATGMDPADAVTHVYDWNRENDREGFDIHTDNHDEGEDHIGCGFMKGVKETPELFGLTPGQGEGLVAATYDLRRQGKKLRVVVYDGAHDPKAWIDNTSEEHTFKQQDQQGNKVFVVGRERARKALGSLAGFLEERGVHVPSEKLFDAFTKFTETAASVLAPGKPRYQARVVDSGNVEVTRTGTIQPLS